MLESERDRRKRLVSAAPIARDPELIVTDDWPETVPIAEAELRVFEAYFGGFLDEIFGP